jgi:hypothetical protein
MKRESFIQRQNKLKKQRNKLGVKIKPKARGPNPMSIKRSSQKKKGNQESNE